MCKIWWKSFGGTNCLYFQSRKVSQASKYNNRQSSVLNMGGIRLSETFLNGVTSKNIVLFKCYLFRLEVLSAVTVKSRYYFLGSYKCSLVEIHSTFRNSVLSLLWESKNKPNKQNAKNKLCLLFVSGWLFLWHIPRLCRWRRYVPSKRRWTLSDYTASHPWRQ